MKLAEIAQRHPDIWAGLKQGLSIGVLGAAALLLVLPHLDSAQRHSSAGPSQALAHRQALPHRQVLPHRTADFAGHAASADTRFVADWVADSRDNRGLPFAILDKRDARVFVFDADAGLIGSSPVLLGLTAGDDSVSDIGMRPMAQVQPDERTTPAGRFESMPGRNAGGEDVVWVDYRDSVSMHRVRPVDPKERRLERLASPDPAQRRISYGCINVPVAFYEGIVQPVLGTRRAVVYVLPDSKPVGEVFAGAYPVAPRAQRQAVNL